MNQNLQIFDLGKWSEKTAQAVRRVCSGRWAPCVAFGLFFFDPTASPEERWSYAIELAFDPHDPPLPIEQERLEKAFQFLGEGVKRIMAGEDDAELSIQ